MFLSQEKVKCPLRVDDDILPWVEEFKYFGVLFRSERKNGVGDQEGCRLLTVSYGKQSQKAKLYRSIYVSTIIYGHDQNNKTLNTSGQNEWPLQGAQLALRTGVGNSGPQKPVS